MPRFLPPLPVLIARAAQRFRLNLNWIFAPALAWRKREPLRLPISTHG